LRGKGQRGIQKSSLTLGVVNPTHFRGVNNSLNNSPLAERFKMVLDNTTTKKFNPTSTVCPR